MEYFDYLLGLFYDGLENFFKSFTLVSGKATIRVLYFSIFYLLVSIAASLTNHFTFANIRSCVLALVIAIIINCVSSAQKNGIKRFKELLKGDEESDGEE